MHPALVRISLLTVALEVTAASPSAAQRIDTRFTATDPIPRQDSVLPVEPLELRPDGEGSFRATLRGARTADANSLLLADSTSESSRSPFRSMAIASTIGGGTGMFLGGLAGAAVGDELFFPVFTGAIGITVGSSLGVGLAGSDHGVNPLEAAFSGAVGFGAGIVAGEVLGWDGQAAVAGFVLVQGLTAATLGWLFTD